jgi:hypothetical protein
MLVRMTDDRWQAEALRGEAVHPVAPLTIVSRATPEGFATDLAFVDGRVAVADHGSGPDELTAVLVADQRYLVEEVGHGSISGETYLDKARERIRRGPDRRAYVRPRPAGVGHVPVE